jgi:hypothetical protein
MLTDDKNATSFRDPTLHLIYPYNNLLIAYSAKVDKKAEHL